MTRMEVRSWRRGASRCRWMKQIERVPDNAGCTSPGGLRTHVLRRRPLLPYLYDTHHGPNAIFYDCQDLATTAAISSMFSLNAFGFRGRASSRIHRKHFVKASSRQHCIHIASARPLGSDRPEIETRPSLTPLQVQPCDFLLRSKSAIANTTVLGLGPLSPKTCRSPIRPINA